MSEGNVGTAAWQINTNKKLHYQVKRLLSFIRFPSLFNPKGDKQGFLLLLLFYIFVLSASSYFQTGN